MTSSALNNWSQDTKRILDQLSHCTGPHQKQLTNMVFNILYGEAWWRNSHAQTIFFIY